MAELTAERIAAIKQEVETYQRRGELGALIDADWLVSLCDLATKGLAAELHPTHQHIKTGSLYQEIGVGLARGLLKDLQSVVIYRGLKHGDLWVRDLHEFHNGKRFKPLSGDNANG